MKPLVQNLCRAFACIALLAMPATAQTFNTFHSFTSFVSSTNSDGAFPYGNLVLSGNTLYGTAYRGGPLGHGTIFAVNTNGSGFATVHSFNGGSEGDGPTCGLIVSSNILYGTVPGGGSSGNGVVFKINANGTGFTVLHNFTGTTFSVYTNSDGATPQAGLILSGETLYGTAKYGGSSGNGTVFSVKTDGSGFTNLHNFSGANGGNPQAGLALSGDTLYGTTYYLSAYQGGGSGYGIVFAVNTNGTGFTNLHTFTGTTDRGYPTAELIVRSNTLYGTTLGSSVYSGGTVFAMGTDGTGFTNLHVFTPVSGSNLTNSDGASPEAGLTLSGDTLYGTTENGGLSGQGTVFKVNLDGSGFSALYSFSAVTNFPYYLNGDGANPIARVVSVGNTLYGTALNGGVAGRGTVFALDLPLPPSLQITRAGNQVVLFWPTNAGNFTLQARTTLSSGTWSNITSGISIVGTNYIFTNGVNGPSSFFRLKQ